MLWWKAGEKYNNVLSCCFSVKINHPKYIWMTKSRRPPSRRVFPLKQRAAQFALRVAVASGLSNSDALPIGGHCLVRVLPLLVEFAQVIVQPDVGRVSGAYFFIKKNSLCQVARLLVFFGDGEKQKRIIGRSSQQLVEMCEARRHEKVRCEGISGQTLREVFLAKNRSLPLSPAKVSGLYNPPVKHEIFGLHQSNTRHHRENRLQRRGY